MSPSAWKETAVLTRDMGNGERRIAGEGSLFAMVKRIASLPDAEWHRYSISLPDRNTAPFVYSAEEFDGLFNAYILARV